MIAFVASALIATVLYVTPGGTGDGSSWNSALGSVAEAYAAAADVATAQSPGEVWIEKGRYEIPGSIAMKPYVVVRGGFAGDETDASAADPENNLTIMTGDLTTNTTARANYWSMNFYDSTYVVKPGSANTPVWTEVDGEWRFNEPNPENDEAFFCTWYGSSPKNAQYCFSDTEGAVGNEFRGIVFTLFKNGAFHITSGANGVTRFSSCRFLGDDCMVNTTDLTHAPVYVAGGSVLMEDCEFVGCRFGVLLTGTGNGTPSVIRNTLFRENSNIGCVYAGGTQAVEIRECTFRRNWSTLGNSAACVWFATTGAAKVEDSLFEHNFAIGGSLGIINVSAQCATGAEINRCRFWDNKAFCFRYTYSNGEKTFNPGQTAGVRMAGKLEMARDCDFARNVYEDGGVVTANGSACVSACFSGVHSIFNCGFRANRVNRTTTGYGGIFLKETASLYIMHCIVTDSVISGEKGAVYANTYMGSNDLGSFFVNSVIDAPNEVPAVLFANNTLGASAVRYSYLKNYDYTAFTNKNGTLGTVDNLYTNGLSLASKTVKASDGREFAVLASTSLWRKSGLPFYEDANGLMWLYAADLVKWYRCDTFSINDTPENITLGESPLLADAVGGSRLYGKTAIGAVNPMLNGFSVMFR